MKVVVNMEWVKELFDVYSHVVESRLLSDAEKIGYLLCATEGYPGMPEISMEKKLQKIREYYHETHDETGA